jgi:biotin synthase
MNTDLELTRPTIVRLLSTTGREEQETLFKRAYAVRTERLGPRVNLRGLIEFSNQCVKNCLYCGIRSENDVLHRYCLSDDEIGQVVDFAYNKGLTGVVLQSGERRDKVFVDRVTGMLERIRERTDPSFRVTLSVGEQSKETYQRWFDAGARRYLLRMETFDEMLYRHIHPDDDRHRFHVRLKCLEDLKAIGYQTGSGVLIGLPGQRVEQLADDLLHLKDMEIDMVGMGPYLEHPQTPMYSYHEYRLSLLDRFQLSLRMIAVLRLMMPTINIASTTALQSIVPTGRELGLKAGANVLMPNLTPMVYRKDYSLYDNKPGIDQNGEDSLDNLLSRIQKLGETVNYSDNGDSLHFMERHIQPNTFRV